MEKVRTKNECTGGGGGPEDIRNNRPLQSFIEKRIEGRAMDIMRREMASYHGR